ncbi:MAG: Crp/Fnr family transcriptional regulator [Bryobacteraceae bacterium]
MSIPCDDRLTADPGGVTPCCEHFAALGRIPLLEGLPPRDLVDEVSALLVKKRLQPGARLFLEGERATGVYLLLSGVVKLYRTSPCGREMMLALIHAPASAGETALFDGEPHPASAVAVEECVAGFLSAPDFARLCRRHPAISVSGLRLANAMVRQLMESVERVRFASLRQRLAAELLELPGDAAPVTHQELASRLGTAREVVSRTLSRMRAQGIVEFSGRRIGILDRGALRREASAG